MFRHRRTSHEDFFRALQRFGDLAQKAFRGTGFAIVVHSFRMLRMEATGRRRECVLFDSVRVDVKDAGLVLVEPDGEVLGHDETFGKRAERSGHALKRGGAPDALERNAQISFNGIPREVSTACCGDASALPDSSSRSSFRILLRTICPAFSSSFTAPS